MPFGLIIVLLILISGSFWAVYKKKLTPTGAFAGSVIALLIFIGTGYTGLFIMIIFFMLATLASVIARSRNSNYVSEQRNALQVIANSGLAASCAIAAYFDPVFSEQYTVMLAGCFSAAASDTISSEMGNAYGTKFFDFRTGKKGRRGEHGVVSMEGIAAGVIGALIIAWAYCAVTNNYTYLLLITAAGILGNFADTLLGAFPERNHLIGNNMVNTLNTLTAAIFISFFG